MHPNVRMNGALIMRLQHLDLVGNT
jgi:hypothetical protein